MGITIDWSGDEMIMQGKRCPHCNSTATEFEPVFQNWKCEDCSTVWDGSGSLSEPDEPSQTCIRCDGSGEIADPNDWGNWGLEPIGGSLTCPCCQGIGTI